MVDRLIQSGWEGWHFLKEDRRLQYPPYTLVEPGQTLYVKPPIKLCTRGLHASKRAIDALSYAPGPVVCRVRLSGEIIEDGDKAVATERTCLWMADATTVLYEFACWCAEQALLREREARREPDPRSWAAVEAKRQWVRGEITTEELAVAGAAAGDAASDATGTVAWAAARAAARVAGTAAWDTAWNTVWDVVCWNTTWAVAKATAWDMTWDTVKTAVWGMTWDTARATAIAQNDKLEEMLESLKGCNECKSS